MSYIRRVTFLILIATLLGAFALAQTSDRHGGTLRFGAIGDVDDLDPHTTGSVSAWLVLENIYERLLMVDANLELQPRLAKEYTISEDGLQYDFYLQEGVKFHNGRELTADDVKASFERIRDPDVPAVAKGSLSVLESIDVVDDYHVRLTLKQPLASILYVLARLETAILPIEEVERQGGKLTEPVGTGPFAFEEHVKDQRLVLVRNPDYWQEGLPYLDRVEYIPVPDDNVRLVNLMTGELDVIQNVPPADAPSVEQHPNIDLVTEIGTFWPHVSMNTQTEPFDDVRVRQAVHLAIDQEEVLELGNWGRGIVSQSPIPPTSPFHAEVEGWDHDPERAKELLAEAGYPDGFETTMRAVRGSNVDLAEIIQAQLAEVGITVNIQVDEQPTWFAEVFNNRDYEMSVIAHVSKIDPDLSLYDILYTDEAKNYTRYSNKQLDELLDTGRSTTDPAKRQEIYNEAQELVVAESGYVVLFLQELLFGVGGQVEGFNLLPTGDIRWTNTWLNQ